MQFSAASAITCGGCTLVNDIMMRPGFIQARNIHNIAWSRDGTRLAGSDAPRSFIAVWDAQSGSMIWRRDLSTQTASGAIGFINHSTLITSADANGALASGSLTPLLDSASGELRGDLETMTEGQLPKVAATCLAPSDDESLLSVAYRKQAYVYLIRFGNISQIDKLGPVVDGLGRTGSTISFLCISPDNALVAIGFTWGEAQVWDLSRNVCVARMAVFGFTSLRGLSFAGPGVLVSCSDGVKSVPTRQIIKRPGYKWAPTQVDMPQATVRTWDAASGEFIRSFPLIDETGTNSVTATRSGSLTACVSRLKHLHVWSVNDGTLVQSKQLPFVSALDPDGDVRFSPDGKRIAAAASSSLFVEHII